jgi:3-oxoacyl-[acyl-carrier protein] reductase
MLACSMVVLEMKHAVITGGGGSLGRAIADALTRPGWVISAPGRDELDVGDSASVARFFKDRPIDLLVCAAGLTRDAVLARVSESEWDEVFTVNFKGAMACARMVLPRMMERKEGHIVFVSSYSAIHPPVGQVAYSTAKAALLGLAVDLASEGGPCNVRVNVVLPGFLETRMTVAVSERRREEIRADHVLDRFNTPETVAKFIAHLHHELLHTSGQIFQLDSRPG